MSTDPIRKKNIFNENDIQGVLNYHYDFYSRYLKNERDILIWLPNSSQTSIKKYPVIYMHDGQNLFNPSTSFSGFDWKVDETVDNLSSNNIIEEVIVVGINNTNDRLDEFNLFTEKGKNYASFLINELKPFVDEIYPTKTDRNNTAVIGSSMGGLCSLQLFWKHQNIFSKAACMSSSFWIDDRSIFNFVKDNYLHSQDFKLYIDCGDAEKELIEDTKRMNRILKKLKTVDDANYLWHIEKGAVHSEVDWAKRFDIPLKFLFGKNNII